MITHGPWWHTRLLCRAWYGTRPWSSRWREQWRAFCPFLIDRAFAGGRTVGGERCVSIDGRPA